MINKLLTFLTDNWAILSSIGAAVLMLLKFTYTKKREYKLGKANLAKRRFIELYIPLTNELHNVKIETFTASKGRKKDLYILFLKEALKLLITYLIVPSNHVFKAS